MTRSLPYVAAVFLALVSPQCFPSEASLLWFPFSRPHLFVSLSALVNILSFPCVSCYPIFSAAKRTSSSFSGLLSRAKPPALWGGTAQPLSFVVADTSKEYASVELQRGNRMNTSSACSFPHLASDVPESSGGVKETPRGRRGLDNFVSSSAGLRTPSGVPRWLAVRDLQRLQRDGKSGEGRRGLCTGGSGLTRRRESTKDKSIESRATRRTSISPARPRGTRPFSPDTRTLHAKEREDGIAGGCFFPSVLLYLDQTSGVGQSQLRRCPAAGRCEWRYLRPNVYHFGFFPSFVSAVCTPQSQHGQRRTNLHSATPRLAPSQFATPPSSLVFSPHVFPSVCTSVQSSAPSVSSFSFSSVSLAFSSVEIRCRPNPRPATLSRVVPGAFPALFATHRDLPWEPQRSAASSDEDSSSSSAYLSVPIDNVEPPPSFYPPRLPLPMHTFHPPNSSSLPPSASCLPPPSSPGSPGTSSLSSSCRYARAEARYQRLSPIKTRRVLHEIRGMSLGAALAHLATSPRRPAYQIFKTIQSALANAIHMYGETTLQPRIKELTANNGPVLKRPFFRARGRMDIRRRPTTHIRVVLEV